MNLKFVRRISERERAIRPFVIVKNKLMSGFNESVNKNKSKLRLAQDLSSKIGELEFGHLSSFFLVPMDVQCSILKYTQTTV